MTTYELRRLQNIEEFSQQSTPYPARKCIAKEPFVWPQKAHEMIRVLSSTAHTNMQAKEAIWFPLSAHTNVQASLSTTFRNPLASLGDLDRLPLELLQAIVVELQLETVFHFRQVNLRARQVVDSMQQYKAGITHGIDAFCSLLRTGLASSISLCEYYALFCDPFCAFCGRDLAVFVYLPYWYRCCYGCLLSRRESLADFRLVPDAFEKKGPMYTRLRAFRPPRGSANYRKSPLGESIELIPLRAVMSAYYFDHGRETIGYDSLRDLELRESYKRLVCCALPVYDPETHEVETGLTCNACNASVVDSNYWPIAGIRSPSQDSFSRRAFLQHVTQCTYAQLMWRIWQAYRCEATQSNACDTVMSVLSQLPADLEKGGVYAQRIARQIAGSATLCLGEES